MKLPRVLFFLPNLPRGRVSVQGIREGAEAVSGSHSSSLLVADGLAARGHEVGVVVLGEQTVADTSARAFADVGEAFRWAGGEAKVVWCSYGDVDSLSTLRAAGARPWMWIHTGVIPQFFRWLRGGEVAGLVTVSDSARLPALHCAEYRRIGRAYNPLSPFFDRPAPADRLGPRHASRQLVFAGYLGESKGAHRILEMWPHVHELLPDATLVLAGSGRLYGERRELGPLGMADPAFEARYLQPLIRSFGSLEASGIRMAGLLAPAALRDLYRRSALGLANLNWEGQTETFCCSAVEMLASSLPVFAVARGALPETVGRSGGAFLMQGPDLRAAAIEVVRLLRSPEWLHSAGEAGRRYVSTHYALPVILDRWELLLSGSAPDLHARTGPWALPKGPRYWAEVACGHLHLERTFEASVAAMRALRDFAASRPAQPLIGQP